MKTLKIMLLVAGLACLPVWAAQAEPAAGKEALRERPEINSLEGYWEHWDKMAERKAERRAQKEAGGDAESGHKGHGEKGGKHDFMNSEKHKALKEELMKLPPEEREARMNELREEFKAKRKEAMEARRAKFQENWDKATPEERERFCNEASSRCGSDGASPKICEKVQERCQGL